MIRRLWLALPFFLFACGNKATCELETTTCGCAARTECRLEVDGCFCPSDCGSNVVCVCGGGTFLACHPR